MYIVIDTGNATTTLAGFEDFSLSSQAFNTSFENQDSYRTQLSKIHEEITANCSREKIKAICVAHTGNINRTDGSILSASHLVNFDRKPLIKDLQSLFPDIPIFLENDSACAAIAESYFGKGKEFSTVGVMYLSWGIGGAYIKKINNTFSLFQVEIGHQIIKSNGRICPCGQRGCLEAYVGTQAIKERFLLDQNTLTDKRIWEELVEYMSIGATNLHTFFIPETIILSGKTVEDIPYVKENLIPKIQEKLRRKKFPVRIQLSSFNEMAPIYGGLALLKIKEGGNSITYIE